MILLASVETMLAEIGARFALAETVHLAEDIAIVSACGSLP